MDNKAEKYLEIVNRRLRPLPLSERTDIISEIKSHIQEMQIRKQVDIDTILNNLGEPSELAKGYIGESIAKNTNFSFNNLLRIIAFYSVTGFSGMFVIPCVAVLSGGLYICTFIALIGGFIKTGGALMGKEIPLSFNLGIWEVPALLSFPVSIPLAMLFYFLSKKLWKYLKQYIATVTKKHQALRKESGY